MPADGLRLLIAIWSAFVTSAGCLVGVDRPANDAAGVRVQDYAAVDLAFPGGVFGDVGQSQLVRGIPGEVAADEILSG